VTIKTVALLHSRKMAVTIGAAAATSGAGVVWSPVYRLLLFREVG